MDISNKSDSRACNPLSSNKIGRKMCAFVLPGKNLYTFCPRFQRKLESYPFSSTVWISSYYYEHNFQSKPYTSLELHQLNLSRITFRFLLFFGIFRKISAVMLGKLGKWRLMVLDGALFSARSHRMSSKWFWMAGKSFEFQFWTFLDVLLSGKSFGHEFNGNWYFCGILSLLGFRDQIRVWE